MGGERESKVDLGERSYRAAKGGGHLKGRGSRDVNGDESAFMEVDVEPGGFRESLQNGF